MDRFRRRAQLGGLAIERAVLSALAALFASGRIADVLLAVFAAEAAYLIGRRRPVLTVGLTLAPGVCFVLALRAALAHEKWEWVAIWIAAALPFHIADLRRRKLI